MSGWPQQRPDPTPWRPPVPVPRRRRSRWLLIAAIVVPCVIVLALIATEALDMARGCGSIDPTDPANYSRVAIVNDSVEPVVVDQCTGTYCNPDDPLSRLDPGQALTVDAACAASGSDMTSWRLTASDDGHLLGYIAVHTSAKQDGLRFRVSRASASRDVATPAG
jgi:hypothetical protein